MKSIIIDNHALYILSAILLAEYVDLQVPPNPLIDKQNAFVSEYTPIYHSYNSYSTLNRYHEINNHRQLCTLYIIRYFIDRKCRSTHFRKWMKNVTSQRNTT